MKVSHKAELDRLKSLLVFFIVNKKWMGQDVGYEAASNHFDKHIEEIKKSIKVLQPSLLSRLISICIFRRFNK